MKQGTIQKLLRGLPGVNPPPPRQGPDDQKLPDDHTISVQQEQSSSEPKSDTSFYDSHVGGTIE